MEASKRRNVSPTTSTLKMLVEDMDASGFAEMPEDGQFIVALPGAESAACTTFGANIDALSENGSALRMVWASARRADRQATGDQKCPVIMGGGGRFTTKLFLTDGNAPSADGYTAGAQLSVAPPTAAHEEGTAFAWSVGYVVRVVNDSATAGTGEIEFMLYDQPRQITDNPQA
jgi:hypothetical protein